MSIECSECERGLRGPHAPGCSRASAMTSPPTEAGEGLKAAWSPELEAQARAIINSFAEYMDGHDRGQRHYGREAVVNMVRAALTAPRPTDAQSIAPYVEALKELRRYVGYCHRTSSVREFSRDARLALDNIDDLLSGQQPAPGEVKAERDKIVDRHAYTLDGLRNAVAEALERGMEIAHPNTPDEVKAGEDAQSRVMNALWPILGGSHTSAELWQEISEAVQDALHTPAPTEVSALAITDGLIETYRASGVDECHAAVPTLRFLRDKIARHTSTATDELVEALKPFAVKVESGAGDDKPCLVPCKIGDVRRACTLLTKLREGKGG